MQIRFILKACKGTLRHQPQMQTEHPDRGHYELRAAHHLAAQPYCLCWQEGSPCLCAVCLSWEGQAHQEARGLRALQEGKQWLATAESSEGTIRPLQWTILKPDQLHEAA